MSKQEQKFRSYARRVEVAANTVGLFKDAGSEYRDRENAKETARIFEEKGRDRQASISMRRSDSNLSIASTLSGTSSNRQGLSLEERRRRREKHKSLSLGEEITTSQLQDLKRVFDEADVDKGGSLDIDEFLSAFGDVLGKDMSNDELKMLFMRIDANANGSIDWDEFSSFLMLGNENARNFRDNISNFEYMEREVDTTPSRFHHRKPITNLLQFEKFGRYVTASKDGSIKFWKFNPGVFTFSQERTVMHTPHWMTDIAPLYASEDTFAVSTIEKRITLFNTEKMAPVKYFQGNVDESLLAQVGNAKLYILQDLHNIPLSLAPVRLNRRNVIVMGLDNGSLQAFDVDKKSSPIRQEFQWNGIHNRWITKVKFSDIFNGYFTCSLDRTGRYTDMGTGEEMQIYVGPKQELLSLDVSPERKLLAMCGLERAAYLYNPVLKDPIAKLDEHDMPLVDVKFIDGENQIITASLDKCIRIFDVRNFKCMQILRDRNSYVGSNTLGAFHFDYKQKQIVTATTQLRPWPMRTARISLEGVHQLPIIDVLYNSDFNQVITLDEKEVYIWDPFTGALAFRYKTEEKLTCASFDNNSRRLITGCANGLVLVWNYINGQVLKKCKGGEPRDLTDVTYFEQESHDINFIVAGGVNRRLNVWEDSEQVDENVFRKFPRQNCDIVSLASVLPHKVAVGTDKGFVAIYNFNSSRLMQTIDLFAKEDTSVMSAEDFSLIHNKQKPKLLFAFCGDGYVRILGSKDGRIFGKVLIGGAQGNSATAVCMSANGDQLIVGDMFGYIRVWDLSSLEHQNLAWKNVNELMHCRHTFRAHEQSISGVAFMDAGKVVFTSSTDKFVKAFTIKGTNIGWFGQPKDWNLSDPDTYARERLPTLEKFNFNSNSLLSELSSTMQSNTEREFRLETPSTLVTDMKEKSPRPPQAPKSPLSSARKYLHLSHKGEPMSARTSTTPRTPRKKTVGVSVTEKYGLSPRIFVEKNPYDRRKSSTTPRIRLPPIFMK